jgi:hypothetical protein
MNKDQEKTLFDQVYPQTDDWVVTSSEAPDFLCYRNGEVYLGVEVTELFLHEGDARLKKVEGYALNLIDGGKVVHKYDRKNIKVEKIKIQNKDGTLFKEINGIFREGIPYKKAVTLLMGTILNKEEKLDQYLKACNNIDLIIKDGSLMFWFDDYKTIFRAISHYADKKAIINSGFREIFLVTKRKGNKLIKIPIKLNLFAEDAFIFEDLILTEKGLKKKPNASLFPVLFYCLNKYGYKDLLVFHEKGNLSINIGAFVYIYTKTGKVIRDYSMIPFNFNNYQTIAEACDELEEEIINIGDNLLQKRKEKSCYIELFFPA